MIISIRKYASGKQQKHREECQYCKNRIQKQIFNNRFKPSLAVKPPHCLVQVKPEDQKEDAHRGGAKYGIYHPAKDQQDKHKGLVVETKDQMIGIGMVFTDVNQINEDREDGKEEENHQRDFGDRIVQIGAGLGNGL